MPVVSAAEEHLLSLAAQRHAVDAELVSSLVEFEASGEWQGYGIRSFGHWCDINLGLSARPVARLTRAAARLRELPVIRAAFEEGSLSADKVQLVAAVATAATDEYFATIARTATVAQLHRICSTYRNLTLDESPEALDARHCRRGVVASATDDGLVRLVAVLEPDEGAIVLAALDARAEESWRASRPVGDDTPAPDLADRRVDALVEMATDGLVTGPEPVVAGERIEVRVIVDADVLTGDRPDGVAAIEGIGAVPLSTVERMLCDCKVSVAALLPDGSLDVGRAQRLPNRRQRRALRHRDRGCRYPGCNNERFVQAHHVLPWDFGGPTDMDNLLLLCPFHHRLFHEGGYTIEALGRGLFRFRRPDRRIIGPPNLRARPGLAYAVPGVPRAEGGGARYDLSYVFDALLADDPQQPDAA